MVIKAPKAKSADDCERLEQLPNIGPSLAGTAGSRSFSCAASRRRTASS